MNQTTLPPNRVHQVAVIGSSEADPDVLALAEQVGAVVARLGAALVTGGRKAGIMTAASRGCAQAGGIVIGIVPTTDFNEANEYCHYVIPTGLGWARNVITGIAGDVIVVIAGAAGTLSEASYAWMHGRLIVAMSCSGGIAAQLAGKTIDNRRIDPIPDCCTITELESVLRKLLDEQRIEGKRQQAKTP